MKRPCDNGCTRKEIDCTEECFAYKVYRAHLRNKARQINEIKRYKQKGCKRYYSQDNADIEALKDIRR